MAKEEKIVFVVLLSTLSMLSMFHYYRDLAREPVEVVTTEARRESKNFKPSQSNNSGENISRININKATKGQLQLLDGIGPALSERIVAYRADQGAFKKKSDIKKVSGIGPKKFEKIKDWITID